MSVGSSYSDVLISDSEFFPGWLDEIWFFSDAPSEEEIRLFANIPELAIIKGDTNNDGSVDFLDITPFIHAQSAEGDEAAFLLLTPDGCYLCADIDMDGAIDFIDITPFVNLLDEAAAVPEPATLGFLGLGLLIIIGFANRMPCKKPA